ncbi:MAG: 6-phosphogluconolactonase [Pseudomonadota bacterium]
MKLETYPDRELMMIDLANTLAGDLKGCLLRHDHASFVVPGGTTPGPIFDNLCAAALDWSRVHVMLSDERWVPEDNPRSNTGLLRARLFQNRAAEARYVPLYAEAEAPEDALSSLIADVERELPISVLLLGMGADMHTASLFPGADNLTPAMDASAPALMAMRAPGAPEPRITLTAPVLAGAMTTHVVITGDEKRAALDAAQSLTLEEAPISVVLRNATVHWAP